MAYTAIDDPEAYFQVQLYTGDGAANNAITLGGDTDMQPDLVWIKNRDAGDSHCLFDAVRGATKVMHSDTNAAEATDTDTLDSFASDGFQVDADVKVNTNTEKYVAWCWKESATSGFDIVAYTGDGSNRTISHSLSAVPHVMIVKNKVGENGWAVYQHKNTAAPETDVLELDSTGATVDNDPRWNDTAPTSSVFTVGTHATTNNDGTAFIAYLFSEKQGFSKFSSYTGNGNADGAFIYTGFRPAWVMIKRNDGANGWFISDDQRMGFNSATTNSATLGNVEINANTSRTEAEGNTNIMDIFSNGFKMHGTGNDTNGSGATYIYFAFAKAPFVNSNGVPCNAR